MRNTVRKKGKLFYSTVDISNQINPIEAGKMKKEKEIIKVTKSLLSSQFPLQKKEAKGKIKGPKQKTKQKNT